MLFNGRGIICERSEFFPNRVIMQRMYNVLLNVPYTQPMVWVRIDYPDCPLHCKVPVSDHKYWMFLGYGSRKGQQHPLVCLACFMRNNQTSKNNSVVVVIQPEKWHKWQFVLIGHVCAMKKHHWKPRSQARLAIGPEQPLMMPIFINEVLEEKNLDLSLVAPSCDGSPFENHLQWLFPACRDSKNYKCTSSCIQPDHIPVLNVQNIHDFVFADPRIFHLYNACFQLVTDSFVWTQYTRKIPWGQRMGCVHRWNLSQTTTMFPRLLQWPIWVYTQHEWYSVASSSFSCASLHDNLRDYTQVS